MANLAYRTVSGATNWSTTASWNVYSLPASGGVFPSGGTWGTASDYPKTGDYVWISSTFSVTYDATAISTNNSATFALISNNIASSSSAVAQPGTGGTNATTGTISLSVASTTTINATYYNIISGTAGLFSITTTSTTFNFTGTWYEGTTGSWILAPSGSNNTINITGNIKSSGTSGTGISLTNVNTLNITGDVTCKAGSAIVVSGANTIINVTGNVYGSDTSTAYAIQNGNTTTNTTITGNLYSGVNAVAIYTPVTSTLTVTGNIRNYGSTGSSFYSAYICPQISIRATSTQSFRTSDAGVKDFVTSGVDPTLTAATIWAYATRVLTAATNITSDGATIDQTKIARLDATVSSRAAASTALDNTVWTGTKAGYLDAAISSRLASSSYVAPDNTTVSTINTNVSALQVVTTSVNTNVSGAQAVIGTVNTNVSGLQSVTGGINTNVTAVKAKTDNLPSDPASNTQVNTRLASVSYVAPDNTTISIINTNVNAVKAKTDNLPSNPASQTNLDVAVSTRLASASYVAPDNATIGTINTNVSSLQVVTSTINTNVSSVQQVSGTIQLVTKSTQNTVNTINTNLSSTQQVVGNIQAVTLSTQAVVDTIQATGGGGGGGPTAQQISNQVWYDLETNPNGLQSVTRLNNVSTVNTTGQQIRTIS